MKGRGIAGGEGGVERCLTDAVSTSEFLVKFCIVFTRPVIDFCILIGPDI